MAVASIMDEALVVSKPATWVVQKMSQPCKELWPAGGTHDRIVTCTCGKQPREHHRESATGFFVGRFRLSARPLHPWNVSFILRNLGLIVRENVPLDFFLYRGLRIHTLNGSVDNVGALLPRVGIGRVGLFVHRFRLYGVETLDVVSVVGGICVQSLKVNLNVMVELVVLFQPLQRPQNFP